MLGKPTLAEKKVTIFGCVGQDVRTMKELLTEILDNLKFACWVEIVTDNPSCTYYFGPFLTKLEAEKAQGGYVEDLETEGATGIVVKVKRCKPNNLTIFNEVDSHAQGIPSFSGQIS